VLKIIVFCENPPLEAILVLDMEMFNEHTHVKPLQPILLAFNLRAYVIIAIQLRIDMFEMLSSTWKL
jgi:hypothetical protein